MGPGSGTPREPHDWIDVRGARVHNLKNIDVRLPRDQLVVVTGLSGSGKSSLAFDTIYAEGQRRYVESLSAYARQFLEQVEKPDVDQIDGLSPAISIEQRTTGSNPRSTVGTVTEIYDFLRLLFANIGVPHCPSCGRAITSQSVERMVETIVSNPPEERVNVLAPIVRGRKGAFRKELAALRARGLTRVRVDGEVRPLEGEFSLDRRRNHSIEVVVDRLVVREGARRRLTEAIEFSLTLADDVVIINTLGGGDRLFSRRLACPACSINMPELSPRAFSFNSPHGACRECQGLGVIEDFDPDRIVPDPSVSLDDGAIQPWAGGDRESVRKALSRLSQYYGIDLARPFGKLPRRQRDLLLFGPKDAVRQSGATPRARRARGFRTDPFGADFEGVVPNLRRRYAAATWAQQEALQAYRARRACHACGGERLRPESRAVRVKGRTMADCVNLSITDALAVFDALELTERETQVAERVLREIRDRMRFLCDVGVGYLSLARGAATLSGGEAQRIRLATQIGASLTGVLYVLDEPSIGLHQHDNQRLLATLGRLRDLGNTVVVVEHDEETIRAADYVVDLGVGAGEHGGHVIFQGAPAALEAAGTDSLTGMYLRGARSIDVPSRRRTANGGAITIRGARANNLKDIDVELPLGVFIAVTGVSGSGKSTLVNDILYRALARTLYRAAADPGAHSAIEGIDRIDKVIQIDQSPIGRTPRSNPATYTGLFTFIREIYSMLPEARARGYRPGRFSFNVKGGRCEACQGDGLIAIEMHFLPDVYVTCEQCRGRRYNRETLEITYRGASIADVLAMTVDQAAQLLENVPSIATKLRTLQDVGLGYLTLGQSATTLSGGEAQRVKLAKELSRRSTGRTLYILDEPTTGLHLEDTKRLLDVLNLLVEQGNTVVVIEHHLDVIKAADHIVDLGPGGGADGGMVVAAGTPETVAAQAGSLTGACLRPALVH
ncbi:MAG: excinuclease ABC subunit UvrA [Acidobacteria bacterium]|nr:excinuclease ABC subunit UvrA [Acidobacteriota bacterium]MXZ73406.1 excinuclease ABC subunit UvrA [Acidobacteriota bacterium]MYD70923.1 excinuclease ABC subunit UvrA [Acidobacteriota bacterium]MYJ05500.1 excinuclease ABC subunit UvrA [Acidobacteriota bacterium]